MILGLRFIAGLVSGMDAELQGRAVSCPAGRSEDTRSASVGSVPVSVIQACIARGLIASTRLRLLPTARGALALRARVACNLRRQLAADGGNAGECSHVVWCGTRLR